MRPSQAQFCRARVIGLFLAGTLALLHHTALGKGGRPTGTVTVGVNDSRVVHLAGGAAEINVSHSEIADVKLLPRNRLLVNGKRLGQTRITVVTRTNGVRHYVIHVVAPTAGLAAQLARLLPRQGVTVDAVGNTIVLGGYVDNALLADRAKKIAGAHLKASGVDGKVLSFLTVRGRQQVQLRVRIAEVSRTAMRQIGVNFWNRTNNRSMGLLAPGIGLNNQTAPDLGAVGNTLQAGGGAVPTGGALPPVPLLSPSATTDAFSFLFSSQDSSSFPMSIAINLLQGKGLAKVLSEPTLVAYSGQEARFVAGGEFPVPIPQALGVTSIEYKKYGVQLSFTPTVLDDRKMSLKVSVSVSEREQTGSVAIQGTQVPVLSTRHSETVVQLENGQSFAVAGLLQDRLESITHRVPLLGDLPIIGMLFRRNSFQRQETELVILVTAHLVQPLRPGEVPPLPGEEEISDPGALRFFLMGTVEAGKPTEPRRGPAGQVGFAR
jgi:pilus assembly protein CpaC